MSYAVTRTTLPCMTSFPSPAEELRALDAELRHLDARRAFLLGRRAWLLNALYTAAPGSTPAAPPVRRPEATAPRVQNVLLVLGGILLTVAAIAFTLVSWGHLGIAGRALVLGAVTVAALGAPVLLLRRGLRSTAEAVAGLGLALTVLDAYALHEVAFAGADGTGYAAAAAAVLATVWAAYGLGLGALRAGVAESGGTSPRTALGLPLPLALCAAQLPLLLWSFAMDASVETVTAVLLATAAADTAIALRVSLEPVRIVAVVGASGWGAWGVSAAGWLSWAATGPGAAARAAALLALAAAIALTTAWLAPKPALALGAALTGGLLAVAGLGGIARTILPEVWTVPAHLLCGLALLAAVRAQAPEPVRRGLVHASAVVQGLALATTVPVVVIALLGPVGLLERIWSGAPESARAAVTLDAPWPPNTATVPLVLAVVAGALALTGRTAPWRTPALAGASVLAWAAVLVLPAVLELPYLAGLMTQGVLMAATLALAGFLRLAAPEPSQPSEQSEPSKPSPLSDRLRSPLPLTGALLALVTSVSLVLLSLATEPTTLVALAISAALFAGAAWRTGLGPLAAPASLVHATALTCAIGASVGWEPQHTALLVLTVPAIAALLAARLGDSPTTIPVEATGAAAGLLAIALSATHPPLLALTLALCGVIVTGRAVRPDRRHLGCLAAVLFVTASWVRLAVWEVGAPEAYTLPVTLPALVVGLLRRRRDVTASSWTAYGPGLAVTLVPSLFAAWGDAHWLRPLLLGAAALAVTLLGARHRLQAPLLLGGATLALVALHELAPYIAQVVDALPRWVPPALAGLALLAAGATYEQRLRDARRVRNALGKLS